MLGLLFEPSKEEVESDWQQHQHQNAEKEFRGKLRSLDQKDFGELDSYTNFNKQERKISNSRKHSDDNSGGSATSLVSRILKPSLRMKAFVNNRQDTFHSLDMHVDHSQEIAGPSRSSPLSLSGELVKDSKNDFLKMPSIESMEFSPSNSTKPYKKVNSEPTMAKAKNSSLDANASGSGPENGEQKKRILHTFTQPNGCIIGYTTEESISNTPEQEEKDFLQQKINEQHK
uniref:Uncharacterized protein n=1 Tax=Ditylenchus dipsaci TaxID=166011 RepID=A0A915EF59_9BILA